VAVRAREAGLLDLLRRLLWSACGGRFTHNLKLKQVEIVIFCMEIARNFTK
jgi:hypothetical protein